MSNLPSGYNEPQSLDNYLDQLEGNIDQLTKERDSIRTALESLNLVYHKVLLERDELKAKLDHAESEMWRLAEIVTVQGDELKAWTEQEPRAYMLQNGVCFID